MKSKPNLKRVFHLCISNILSMVALVLLQSFSLSAWGVVYVNKNATGANNGNSWTDAYTTIQAGIDDADVADEEVWVAQGTYAEAIVMKSGVKLYGGFNGTETSRDQRNWTTNVTTIDASTARGGLPAYHVVIMDNITTATIDGFTITGGNANGGALNDIDDHGGGIYCYSSSPAITNNTISGNSANGTFGNGAGIYCYSSSPAITNNTISGNSANGEGGGIYCYSSSPAITNNTISANSADDAGGGIYCQSYSWPAITNNTISGNSATGTYGSGGGIYCACSPREITNNTISGNSAYYYGGGIYCDECSPAITNNTISGNSANGEGGGIYCYSSSPAITNNTISGNSASSGGGILCHDYSSPAITNNTISGNSANYGGGILCDWYSSPAITNNIISGNSATGTYGSGGGIYCSYSSPAITNNIISGNSADWGGGGIFCYGPSPQITNNTISGNLANYGGGGILCEFSDPQIKNTIFYNNNKYDIYEFDLFSDPIVSYNDFYGNPDGVYYDEGTTPYTSVAAMDSAIAECSNNIGLDPLFVGDTLSGGSWTATPVYNSATFQTTLTNSSASWTVNEHAGRLLNPDTSQNKQFVIVNNTTTTINVWGDVTSIAQIGDMYRVLDYHLQLTSPCIDSGCLITGLTEDFEGDPRPFDGTSEPRGDGSDYDIGADEYYIGATPTPTVTPTPSPTPWQIVFDFTENCSDWTTATAALVFSPPEFVCDVGFLRIFSATNTNTFGCWTSPEGAVPVEAGYLYRAGFNVSTDITDQSLVPQIRVRANSSNLQQSDYITVESVGNGAASPLPAGTDYDLYFVPPANANGVVLAFDLLNFNPADAAAAEVGLHQVVVDRFALTSLGTPTTAHSYTFDASTDGWTTGGAPVAFAPPNWSHSGAALNLTATNNTNCFGYWQGNSTDVVIAANQLYRGSFTVRTDVTSKSAVPQMRLRFNTENLQASRTLGIESIGDGASSPGATNTTYDRLYFLPPANCAGSGLIVSFDMLNFSPDDAPNGNLLLDSVTVESLVPPTMP